MEAEIQATLQTPDTELTHKVIYPKQLTKLVSPWMELVSKLAAALNGVSDIDEFRQNFNTIVDDIESKIDAQQNPQVT